MQPKWFYFFFARWLVVINPYVLFLWLRYLLWGMWLIESSTHVTVTDLLSISFPGAIMENLARDLLDLKMCSFLPKHKRNLSNEFRCFVNYPSRLLSSWADGWDRSLHSASGADEDRGDASTSGTLFQSISAERNANQVGSKYEKEGNDFMNFILTRVCVVVLSFCCTGSFAEYQKLLGHILAMTAPCWLGCIIMDKTPNDSLLVVVLAQSGY